MASRPIWTGAIRFGLINIPVRLYTASKERSLSFHFLRKRDLCPIKYIKVCRATGESVSNAEIVKGYEYSKGDYVILSDADFKKADPKKEKAIDVMEFVEEAEVDSKLFMKPYYLEPVREARKAYVLLREAMKKSKKAALVKFVLRAKEYLGVLQIDDESIVLNQMRYQDELVKPKMDIPEENISEKELDISVKLIDQLTAPFKPEEYRDTHTEKIKEVIEAKARGRELKRPRDEAILATQAPDIMAKLRESLELAQRRHK